MAQCAYCRFRSGDNCAVAGRNIQHHCESFGRGRTCSDFRLGGWYVSGIVGTRLQELAKDPSLHNTIARVDWENGMRLRIVFELDLEDNTIRTHGYEFRYRKPGDL
jgi:hypothetical protein